MLYLPMLKLILVMFAISSVAIAVHSIVQRGPTKLTDMGPILLESLIMSRVILTGVVSLYLFAKITLM